MRNCLISWEIRGRRLINGSLLDVHVGVGYGSTSDSAIAWLCKHSPSATASFAVEDLRAIQDPVSASLPVAPVLLAACVLLVSVCATDGGQSSSQPPEVFHDEVGLSAGLPSQSTREAGSYFDRDLLAGVGIFLGGVAALVMAGIRLERLDREESARRVRAHWNNLSTPIPGAECISQPSADSGTGERRGFSQS